MSNIDFYFDDYYGKLYEKAEGGQACIFTFQCEYGKVSHQFIKRRIPSDKLPTKDGAEYYDIVSPYGYGGPVIEEVVGNSVETCKENIETGGMENTTKTDMENTTKADRENTTSADRETAKETAKAKLVEQFSIAFTKYCEENNIVCEFVRFHPMVENALDFKEIYNPKWDRHTLGTNLKDYEDPVATEFTKHCRKRIRQALNKGVTFKVTEHPTDLSGFRDIYFDTMDRNEASDFYYFDDEYFKACVEHYSDNLLLVEAIFEGQTIAAGMYFTYNKWIHIHLSGTRHEFLSMSPAYVLRYALALWGKEHGYEMIHHGGGRSNDPEDSLYLFKEQFATNTKFDFYVGRKVWLKDKYMEICRFCEVDPDSAFFPAYRSR